jgi:hypothetical protein
MVFLVLFYADFVKIADMKNLLTIFLSCLSTFIAADPTNLLNTSPKTPSLMSSQEPTELIVYNRVLARIHGKQSLLLM